MGTQRVRFSGEIFLNGARQAACGGWATKATLMEGNFAVDEAYGGYEITDDSVSSRVRDGIYELFAHGKATRFQRVNGRWLSVV